jgi:hypothetical protein
VTPPADPLPGQPAPVVKPGDGPQETSPPRRTTLAELQEAVEQLRSRISDLDAQLLALDNAYRLSKMLNSNLFFLLFAPKLYIAEVTNCHHCW